MKSNEFKKIKYILGNCFLLDIRLIINITMLIFRTILNNEPVTTWIWSDPNNGFKNLPNIKSK